jgi:hypothetical protein
MQIADIAGQHFKRRIDRLAFAFTSSDGRFMEVATRLATYCPPKISLTAFGHHSLLF